MGQGSVSRSNRLGVRLAGVPLENPILTASGAYGFGYELADSVDPNQFGALVLKGTTPRPRFGNPAPRIAETPAGMLNAIGLQNPGVDAVIAEELPKLARVCHKKVIANIAGFAVEDYVTTAVKFDQEEQVALLELNISCPNVTGGGLEFGTTPEAAYEVTAAVKSAVKKPVFVKLSPNVTDVVAIAQAVEEAGADGVTLINTLKGMRIDLKKRAPLLANRTGGLSGPALFPIAIRMVYEVFEATNLPMIGVGGIQSAEDVLEMMMAGATAVEIGAAGLVDPSLFSRVIQELPTLLDWYGFDTIESVIGAAHEGRKA